MKFLCYFELDISINPQDIVKARQKLTECAFEMPNFKVTNGMVTAEYWGIAIVESDDEADRLNNINRWKVALPNIFSKFKFSPGMLVEDYMPKLVDMIAAVNRKK